MRGYSMSEIVDVNFEKRIDACRNCLGIVQLVSQMSAHYGRPSPDDWPAAAVAEARDGQFEYALLLLRAGQRLLDIVAEMAKFEEATPR